MNHWQYLLLGQVQGGGRPPCTVEDVWVRRATYRQDGLVVGVQDACWSQSHYDLTMIKPTETFHRIPLVFVVGIRREQVKRLYSGVSALPLQNTAVPFFFQTLHTAHTWFVHSPH